ncbi:MAG: aspartate 1-decarboxylase [Endomicrobium sp.]|jgi:aspartate 1-decarboxylase|nr:aspartate 1-decarboxylase [Endomicrobium sp.]
MKFVLSSKIFKARVTQANINYEGSITIDTDLCDKAGFWIGEKVLVVSNTTGNRLETYIISGESGSGVICMNGAAAHLIKEKEEVIIMGFKLSDKPIKPKIVFVDKNNKAIKIK